VGLLIDIDGTVLDAGHAIDGAAETIAWLRDRGVPFLFATNISRKPRSAIAESLRGTGLPVEEHEILSASFAAATHLRSEGIRRVQLLLPPLSTADFEGLELTEERPEAVVVGDMGSLWSFETLNTAFQNLRAGARLVAIHRNRYWKSEEGWALDAGAFVTGLEYAARVEAELIGKPSPGFFRMAAHLTGTEVGDLSIVGDDLESDIAGGRAAGLTTYLVKTGKFDESRLATTPPEQAPHHVIASIRSIPDCLG
jgi:HAD superfamily hydrolase (TIGR01458 family)